MDNIVDCEIILYVFTKLFTTCCIIRLGNIPSPNHCILFSISYLVPTVFHGLSS